jgi:hypothetical protein
MPDYYEVSQPCQSTTMNFKTKRSMKSIKQSALPSVSG